MSKLAPGLSKDSRLRGNDEVCFLGVHARSRWQDEDNGLGKLMDVVETVAYAEVAANKPADRIAGRYWTLTLLVLIATISMVDKAFVTVLFDPIKQEFDLTDRQVGSLTTAFSIFFGVAGIGLGMAADRTNRRNLLTGCMIFWSFATVGGGMAATFLQLFILRFLVGAGESGATPSALSMISDLFRARERATAVGIYYFSTPLGSGIALTVGALVAHAYGWRTTMMLAGLPGLLLSLLFLLTVKEPRRLSTDGAIEREAAPPLGETFRFILSQRSLLHVAAGITLVTISINGFGMWMFPFFTRVDHVPGTSAGWEISLATYPASALAIFLTGIAADRLAPRDERWRVWLPAILAFACLPMAIAAVSAGDPLIGLVFTGVWMAVATGWYGAGYGVCQALVRPRMRATLNSILLLLTTLLGFGLGPFLTGAISDWLAPSMGVRSIGYGMIATNLLAVWAGIHFLLAGRSLGHDLATVTVRTGGNPA
jgi:MFS family permease